MAVPHGTTSGYTYKCRCQSCARAWANMQRARRGLPALPDIPPADDSLVEIPAEARIKSRRRTRKDAACRCCGDALDPSETGMYCSPACFSATHERRCEECGTAFAANPGADSRKFCSLVCNAAYQSRTRGAAPRVGRTCIQCAATFKANNAEQRTCSHECARAYRAAHKPAPEPKLPKPSRVYFPVCKGCGRVFCARSAAKRWCSYRCQVNDVAERINSLYALACDMKRPGESRAWRKVLLGYLVERDGDRCGICRKRVDLSLRSGTRGNPMGPSVDHIVPRSQGGSDDLTNLRLAHWKCNNRRGNRGGFEQLALVG